MARSTVTNVSLNKCVVSVKKKISDMLKDKDSVSLTTDIWSDRVMRSFLGVTIHTNVLDITTGAEELRSFLLSCKRFSGSHTGTRIAAAFDDILETYVISNKVEYILTDNASNMKSAFKVNFPAEDDDDDDDDVDDDGDDAASVIQSQALDDESIWETLDSEEEDEIRDVLDSNCKKRLSCFAHSLQLVIGDGLKETKGVTKTIKKSNKLSTSLHRSTVLKEK